MVVVVNVEGRKKEVLKAEVLNNAAGLVLI
jgi:hypothetical protein